MLIGIPLVLGVGGLVAAFFVKKHFEGLARGAYFGRPVALFGIGIGGAMLPAVLVLKGVVPGLIIECPTARLLMAMSVAILGGTWALMVLNWSRNRLQETPESFPIENTLGALRLQLWFQDLLIAALCFGFGAALVTSIFKDINQQTPHLMLQVLLYLFIAGSFGMFVAADVSRRSAFGQNAPMRAGIFVTIFFLFPLCLPLAAVAWWLWRGALKKSAEA